MACSSGLRVLSAVPPRPSPSSGARKIRCISVRCSSSQRQRILEVIASSSDRLDAYQDLWSVKHNQGIQNVRSMLSQIDEPLGALELIDSLHRLGIDHHFDEEIKETMENLHNKFNDRSSLDDEFNGSLHNISLLFRLLRHNGHHISSGVFSRFTDTKGKFKLPLQDDVKGILGLYEASFLNMGENILDEAKEFSYKYLKASAGNLQHHANIMIKHSLEYPLHISSQRFKAQHYIRHYKGSFGKEELLRELAVMDFNIVQLLHQKELAEFCRWWRGSRLSQELKFSRDQPLKWFMCAVAVLPDPRFSECRVELAKSISFIYIIDDIFDVYASFDELVLFTEAIKQWDPSSVDQLPIYMKICYNALYNITNEVASMVHKRHGWNPIQSLRKSWTTLCEAFQMEANWFGSGYIPKPNEYLENGVISSGVHIVLVHLFFLIGDGITKESIAYLDSMPGFVFHPAMILRLWDDLGSAKDENQGGFDGSYVECYMKEHPDSSHEGARKHVMRMIDNSWKELHKEFLSPSPFTSSFRRASMNLARMVPVMYSYSNQSLPMLEEYVRLVMLESI